MDGTREVPFKDGEQLARQMGTLFIETSAKTTAGVQEAFEEVVHKVTEINTIVETPGLWQKSQVPGSGLVLSQDVEKDSTYCGC